MAWKSGLFAGVLALSASCMQGMPSEKAGDAGRAAGIESMVEKHALLISGKSQARHILNMSLVYNFLLEQGFEKENIYVLDENGEERYYLYPVDGEASRKNIEEAFGSLRSRIDENDLLFVYVSDHGSRKIVGEKEVSTIRLPGVDLDQLEFLQYIEGINLALGLFVFEPCYSGGFGKTAGAGNIIAFASAGADAEANTPSEYDSAGVQFILGFRNKSESDANNDGRVSVQEAFDYMLENHTRTRDGEQHPAIYSDLNTEEAYFF